MQCSVVKGSQNYAVSDAVLHGTPKKTIILSSTLILKFGDPVTFSIWGRN